MKKKLLLALAILLGGIGFAKADVLANAQYLSTAPTLYIKRILKSKTLI